MTTMVTGCLRPTKVAIFVVWDYKIDCADTISTLEHFGKEKEGGLGIKWIQELVTGIKKMFWKTRNDKAVTKHNFETEMDQSKEL